jgi:hypothetical protein
VPNIVVFGLHIRDDVVVLALAEAREYDSFRATGSVVEVMYLRGNSIEHIAGGVNIGMMFQVDLPDKLHFFVKRIDGIAA